ncbi:glycosyltransferase family 4 protein [Aminipila luticellarii]|uniref:Glycosyltransferase family 1 protein n=1 Tax=Aminipila luticellarii TaxID=2507160 RepID=A0A410PSL1_9FIRM|nr:glycosyltransferase family 4 protein [Aminipila luticellarii]QAT41900.1 glycosyltransferase family 1 protein [Aminipila luticellarii]
MKRILLIGNNDGGLYLFRIELIEELISLGYEVHFTVPYGEKVPLLIDCGAIYHQIDMNRRGMNIKEDFILMCNYRKLFKMVKPQVILTYTIKPNIYAGLVAKVLRIPCIATITGLGTSMQGQGKKTNFIKILYKYGLKGASYIFFQNEENKNFFINNKLIEAGKALRVNGSGVNTEKFRPKRCKHDGINILYISRIMKDKGIREYLEAARVLKPTYNFVNFQILGFYDEEILKNQINDLVSEGSVSYLGVSLDTRIEMEEADCIVLPSYHEGMSNVLLEGAAFGLPLITSNIHGCKEAVDEGVTGFLCEPRDAQSLIESIKSFLLLAPESRKKMGDAGREKMIKEFDRKLVVTSYINVIQNMLSQQGK